LYNISKNKVNRLAICGNPNCGKSTLFNVLTGLRQKTGNFPGVTVDKKTGKRTIKCQSSEASYEFDITDLPGTYSLYPKSMDEQVTFDVLTNTNGIDFPDIILIVLDASNLKRNLLLASQIIDLDRPVVIALNMIDIAEDLGYEINIEKMERLLGAPVAAINSRDKKGIKTLEQKILSATNTQFIKESKYEKLISITPAEFKSETTSVYNQLINFSLSESFRKGEAIAEELQRFEYKDNMMRFQKISNIWEEAVIIRQIKRKKSFVNRLDEILLHRFAGPLVFLFVLFLIFQSVFYIAELPMNLIESLFLTLSNQLNDILPQGKISSLLTDGIISGLSGIVIFVPQIALLFGFLAILEDSGYMARVTVIMDRLMRSIGLNGRSVIPLISGIACAVPSVMGARTIPNWRERLVTIMVTPLVSCSARLPVFTLLISLMVPENSKFGFLNERGLWLLGLYLSGFISAILVSFALKFIIKTKEKSHFIMELPVYRIPQWRTVFITMFEKIKVFLFDAGKVILVISILLWVLKSFGPGTEFRKCELQIQKNTITILNNKISKAEEDKLLGQNSELNSKLLENSYAGYMGRFIEPAIKPLGFDWKIGISLITSFAAREVFVGTMATIYSSSEDEIALREKIASQKNLITGEKVYSYATCLSLLVFYLFAMQCMSTMAVVKRETKSWKWPIFQFLYMGALAWISSFIVFNWFK
jgi:ferrous iron transport protein B